MWNIGSFWIEYLILVSIFRSVPALATKAGPMPVPQRGAIAALQGWNAYKSQMVFPAGVALALLFMTVLSLDGITTGFAYDQGLQENLLAGVRGIGAMIGIAGSFAFPK